MKVYLDAVGCRLNQSEIERYAQQFHLAGHELVPSAEQADLVIINTCDVTSAAASDSRQKIRQAGGEGTHKIILTGCWSTLHPEASWSLPGVAAVIDNAIKDDLVSQVLDVPKEYFDREFLEREPVPGARMRTRAFIKAQDGCNNRCTFCVTVLARGPGRSRSILEVIGDVQAAVRGGAQEAVLTGVHLGSWGQDINQELRLPDLIQSVLEQTEISRLRLSSVEPWDVDDRLFALWENPRLCRHLHLPLQSGCAATLRRMARKVTPGAYKQLIETVRSTVPGIAVTTDVIAGFPGETEAEFAESLQFVEAMHFAGGHVFTYSARPGTAAAQMPNQVPHPLRKTRNLEMRMVLMKAGREFERNFMGTQIMVLWESAVSLGPDCWVMSGLTDNYLRVRSITPQNTWNQITPVMLTGIEAEHLSGTIMER